ncbi:hypothetical protein E2C01_059682 [Portunus trituberculatus]|uniref:Uncharacterized protein n=1 Tax=Portunus trituberculatus TaxID=210409 RepID=A0A5B7H7C2_PORTR|nr:hypothetical protein [Portunus trituberculatus]
MRWTVTVEKLHQPIIPQHGALSQEQRQHPHCLEGAEATVALDLHFCLSSELLPLCDPDVTQCLAEMWLCQIEGQAAAFRHSDSVGVPTRPAATSNSSTQGTLADESRRM